MTKHCPQENAAGLDQYHSVAAVAEALELSHWTVRDYIREGLLPAFKVGSGAKAPVRIRAADLAKLLTPITAAEVVGQSLRGP